MSTEPRPHAGVAGASARRKAQHLREDREKLVSKRSALGSVIGGIFPSSAEQRLRREEANWTTGAHGEEKLAELLARRCSTVLMLHDRRVPMSAANIDHIAFAPTGVHVIDAKRYKGKIQVVTPLFGSAKLKINGRDRTKLIDGLGKQVALVRAAVAEVAEDVPVHGCLCFITPEGLLADVGLPMLRTLSIDGYPLYYPSRLARRLKRPGPLGAEQARLLYAEIEKRLPAAAA